MTKNAAPAGAVFLAHFRLNRTKNTAPAGAAFLVHLMRLLGPKNAAPAASLDTKKKTFLWGQEIDGTVFLAVLGPKQSKNAAPAGSKNAAFAGHPKKLSLGPRNLREPYFWPY